jgi:hypothetical protein
MTRADVDRVVDTANEVLGGRCGLKLSVLIPVFNEEAVLPCSLRSFTACSTSSAGPMR